MKFNKIVKLVIMSFGLTSTWSQVLAEVTVENISVSSYKNVYSNLSQDYAETLNQELLESYILGVGNGYISYNEVKYSLNQTSDLCINRSISLTSIDYNRILSYAINSFDLSNSTPIDIILISSIQNEFKCTVSNNNYVSPNISSFKLVDYLRISDSDQTDQRQNQLKANMNFLIQGIGNGIVAANEMNKISDLQDNLLCFPSELHLGSDDYLQLINDISEKFDRNTPVEVALTLSMYLNFRCN